ncbi:putative amino-acid permease protein YxeN [Philodulcilactobacillus myokoensis]|uniref:Amino-acid permease protein YxeN n=1 Tax=Philodulcilactobacillus myokoensis TaxID=2929573 RepID=A0A9W6AZD6_9LACO|nr:amino acid ABC transporter permease [Philodulcilactobacillus myokoensis]GLB46309.1 putative amino-acid permease protein YxeN [Philodulcilactobacillus myokoensis]
MNWGFMFKSFPKLLSVLPITLYLSIIGTLIGLILAILIAIGREKKIVILTPILNLFVSVMRGVPTIVQIYIVYYGLPRLIYALFEHGANSKAITLSSMTIGVVAFALNSSANLSEAIRAAYHSVDHSQYDAALSVGMTPYEAIKRIVLPQLIPNFIPNFTNVFLDIIKDTSLVYNIGIVEIMGKANIIASFAFNYLEAYLDALVIYLIVCFIFARILSWLENIIRRRVFA